MVTLWLAWYWGFSPRFRSRRLLHTSSSHGPTRKHTFVWVILLLLISETIHIFPTIFHQIHFCVFISWLWDDSNTCSFHIWAAGRARNENSLLFTFRLRIWHCSSGSVDTAIDKKWHRVTMWIWKTKLATTRTLLACRPARKKCKQTFVCPI